MFACLRQSLAFYIAGCAVRIDRAIQLIGVKLVSCRTRVMITFTHSLTACRRPLPSAFNSTNQTTNDWSHINSTKIQTIKTQHLIIRNCSFNRIASECKIIIHFYAENKLSNSSIQFACKSYVQFKKFQLVLFDQANGFFFENVLLSRQSFDTFWKVYMCHSKWWVRRVTSCRLGRQTTHSTMPYAFASNEKKRTTNSPFLCTTRKTIFFSLFLFYLHYKNAFTVPFCFEVRCEKTVCKPNTIVHTEQMYIAYYREYCSMYVFLCAIRRKSVFYFGIFFS